jgi:hypothetical protein
VEIAENESGATIILAIYKQQKIDRRADDCFSHYKLFGWWDQMVEGDRPFWLILGSHLPLCPKTVGESPRVSYPKCPRVGKLSPLDPACM